MFKLILLATTLSLAFSARLNTAPSTTTTKDLMQLSEFIKEDNGPILKQASALVTKLFGEDIISLGQQIVANYTS